MTRLKRNNRALLLSLLHQEGPMSRLDMSVRTGLTPATISGLTREMIEAGIMREMGPDPAREATLAGRKPILLDLCPDSRLAAGLVVHSDQEIRVGIVNLRGQLVGGKVLAGSWQGDRTNLAEQALALITELTKELAVDPARLLGIGVGLAGLVEAGNTTGLYPNYLTSTYVTLREAFGQSTKIPVFVDNNVKAMALGEMLFGAGRQVENLVFFKVGPGIGSAVVLNGELYRGSHQGASEIGHTVFKLDGPKCVCGRQGCLEALASPRALIIQAKELVAQSPASPLARLTGGNPGAVNFDVIMQALWQQDSGVAGILTEAGRYLGTACANLINLFDPDVLVLHGALFNAGPPLADSFAEALQTHVYSQLPDNLRIQHSTLGNDLEVIGAASLALDRFFFSHRLELD